MGIFERLFVASKVIIIVMMLFVFAIMISRNGKLYYIFDDLFSDLTLLFIEMLVISLIAFYVAIRGGRNREDRSKSRNT